MNRGRRPETGLERFIRRTIVLVAIIVVGAIEIVVGVNVLPGLIDTVFPLTGDVPPRQSATPLPSGALLMNGVAVKDTADCAGCHATDGNTIGLAVIPAMAHPVAGWSPCLSCHADERLVPTAPGHREFTQDQCTACHTEQGSTAGAPPRPHHVYEGQECTSCHNGSRAPLPAAMEGRTACWLCHHEAPGQTAFPSVPPSP